MTILRLTENSAKDVDRSTFEFKFLSEHKEHLINKIKENALQSDYDEDVDANIPPNTVQRIQEECRLNKDFVPSMIDIALEAQSKDQIEEKMDENTVQNTHFLIHATESNNEDSTQEKVENISIEKVNIPYIIM